MKAGTGMLFPFFISKKRTEKTKRGAEVAVKYVLAPSSGYLSAMFAPQKKKRRKKMVENFKTFDDYKVYT